MEVQLAKRLITVDEYHTMAKAGILTRKDKVELIHGEILEMSPTGKKHRSTVIRIENNLKKLFGKKALISVRNPINISDLNEPEPDVTILKKSDDYYHNRSIKPNDIRLVIEVSDTTYHTDKEIKLPLYASAGILEYWVVNLQKSEIEVHRFPEREVYKRIQIAQHGDSIELSFCQKSIKVDNLLGKLS